MIDAIRHKIKAGEIVTVTEGEYSDYQVMTVVRALRDFNPAYEALLCPKVMPSWGIDEDDAAPTSDSFLAYLIAEGLVEELDAGELWMGAYGTLENGPHYSPPNVQSAGE